MASSSVWSLLVNVFAAPTQALGSLRSQQRSWFPLFLLMGLWIVFWYWYYKSVNFTWLLNHFIELETQKVPADQHQAVTQRITGMKPGAFITLSSLLVIIVLLLVAVVTSTYFVIVSAFLDHDYRFRHWFALIIWASTPSLFSILVMVLNFTLAHDGRIAPENLNPLSFANLLGLQSGNRYTSLLGGLDLTSVWSWGLLTLGFRLWTQRSWTQSLVIVMIPPIAIYGTWALLA